MDKVQLKSRYGVVSRALQWAPTHPPTPTPTHAHLSWVGDGRGSVVMGGRGWAQLTTNGRGWARQKRKRSIIYTNKNKNTGNPMTTTFVFAYQNSYKKIQHLGM